MSSGKTRQNEHLLGSSVLKEWVEIKFNQLHLYYVEETNHNARHKSCLNSAVNLMNQIVRNYHVAIKSKLDM